jgi:methylated-DNA-[protein]-cysteine S-methyltransferase
MQPAVTDAAAARSPVVAPAYTVFATALGDCAIAWGDAGIVAVQLPETDESAIERRLLRRIRSLHRAEPSHEVRQAIASIVALLHGDAADLLDIRLDMRGVPPFHCRVYQAARQIPPGATRTYGEVALQLGSAGLARAVGQALGHNPFAPVVPCHRVLAANGRPGGFSAHGALKTKLRMLLIEGADPTGSPDLFSATGCAGGRE